VKYIYIDHVNRESFVEITYHYSPGLGLYVVILQLLMNQGYTDTLCCFYRFSSNSAQTSKTRLLFKY